MKILFKYATVALLLAGAAACSQPSKRASIIDENIAVAEKQIGMLADSSETGGVIRIPSTWKNGRIDYVPVDDWVSGFFAGTLWYMYELTGDEAWAARARKHTEILDSVQYLQWHHDVGFMVYDSYGNGLRLKNIPGYEDVIVQTAKSLATRFRPVPGVIQSWDADRGWQGERGWQCPVIIDNMMNLEHLYNAGLLFGDDTLKSVAVTHANTTLCNHFRPDFTSYHLVDYDPADGRVRRKETVQGFSDESAWARGQAWALYGYTMMFRLSGYECYLNQAENIAGMLLERLPDDGIPYWDFDSDRIPDDLRDASAAAIMASAFVDLSSLTNKPEEKGRYLKMAEKQLRTLASDAYLARPGENGNFLLMHSVGSRPDNHEIDVPLTYADYYFLEALLKYSRTTQTKPNNN